MKTTKKCDNTNNKRRSSAGMFYTSSAGAVTSLILMRKDKLFITSHIVAFILIALLFLSLSLFTGATGLFGLNGSAYADYTISMTSSGAQEIDVLPSSNPSGVGTKISTDAVTVTTTCPAGYNLTTTTSVNDNKLYLNGSSSNNATDTYFNPSDGTTALSNAPNTWGFYQDGSTVPTASSVFKPVPISTSTPSTIRTSSSTSDSFNIYYGVAVGNNLAPGTYKMIPNQNNANENGTIVYYLTMAEECLITKQYMQDVTEADLAELMPDDGDSATLYDKRDGSDYQITKINDNYWMTQNLRITHTTGQPVGTILAENSNFDNDITFDGDLTSGNSYTAKRYHVPTETDLSTLSLTADQVGVWYNTCAVSAGEVCNNTVQMDATNDICPSGWRLPNLAESSSLINYASHFSSVYSGYWSSSTLSGSAGYWWTSSGYSKTGQSRIGFENSILSTGAYNKRYGLSVRCVKKEDPKPPISTNLYDAVASMSKGTQTLEELRAEITTSNSGVYEYNSSVFGTASDAANTSKIYYYRGILDNTTGTYGSDGDNAKYPNTVVLSSVSSKSGLVNSDTCWRIVRTTGSGGVKMIYQGKWTGSTCAHATMAAQVTTKAFDTTANSSGKSIIGVGYTNNATYKSTTAATAYSTLFGSNTSYSGNSTSSTMKTYIEGTWFTNINAYASKLEQSAGWCNDRTIRTSNRSTSVIPDSTNIDTPYATATSGNTAYYFGPYVRTRTTSDKPTLGCPRNNADLYTTSSATNGNKQLGKPAALITADEAAFAGSGYSSSTTPYHANSYLSSGSLFWLLSPGYRSWGGNVFGYSLRSSGNLYDNNGVNAADGVRPSISLTSGTTAVSGTGTATDPWIVNP